MYVQRTQNVLLIHKTIPTGSGNVDLYLRRVDFMNLLRIYY